MLFGVFEIGHEMGLPPFGWLVAEMAAGSAEGFDGAATDER